MSHDHMKVADDCELYAKVHGSNIIVVENDWKPGDPERIEPRDTLLKAAAAIKELNVELIAAQPLYSRRKLEEENTKLREQLVSARSDAIKECASLAQRWATDAAEFNDSDRCRVQHNVCRNMAVAIGNLAKTDEEGKSRT